MKTRKRETIGNVNSKRNLFFIHLPYGSKSTKEILQKQLKRFQICFFIVCIVNLFLGGLILYLSLTDDGSYEYLPIENISIVYLEKDNSTLVLLDKELRSKLNDLYFIADREFQICLNGTKILKNNKTIYTLNSFHIPEHQKRWRNAVSGECPEGYLVKMHSHPENTCLTNTDDIKVFQDYLKEELMGTICGKNKFFFIFDKENPKLAEVK